MTDLLGFGAMGQVYRAEHDLMGRKAAIKVLNGALSRNEEVVQRFLNEARAVNDIRHPHVVEITDFGEAGGRYYLIMELLEGETLADCLVQCGSLSAAGGVRVASQIASALDAAHGRGIVHRDLKPDNVFLIDQGDESFYVKLLDFGVAKLMGPARSARSRQTELGALVGTPHYMSPEQCLGELEVGPQSDVYSLGVMLYEMLAGTLPFEKERLSELLMAHIHEPPVPIRQYVPDLPEYLSAAVMRALHKVPGARHGGMGAFRRALLRDPLLADSPGEDVLPAPVPPRTPPQPQPTEAGSLPDRSAVPGPRRTFSRANTMLSAREGVASAEARRGTYGLSDDDLERPQRVGNKLSGIIRERIQSQNLVLPTMPHVAVQCTQLIGAAHATFSQLAAILAQDPLLSAQVLRVANSVAFASLEKAKTLDQAISRLGNRQLRMLLIELSARTVFRSRERRIHQAFNGIWEHSLAVAGISRGLSRMADAAYDAETVYLAGLLHDLGKPMTGSLLLEAERRLSVREQPFMTPDLWMQVVEDTHRDVGRAIVRSWNMPDEVADAVAHCGQYGDGPGSFARNVVTLANGLAEQAGYAVGQAALQGNEAVVERGLAKLQLESAAVTQLIESIADRVDGYANEGESHAVA